jgi:hypothetical protein
MSASSEEAAWPNHEAAGQDAFLQAYIEQNGTNYLLQNCPVLFFRGLLSLSLTSRRSECGVARPPCANFAPKNRPMEQESTKPLSFPLSLDAIATAATRSFIGDGTRRRDIRTRFTVSKYGDWQEPDHMPRSEPRAERRVAGK